MTKVDFTNWLHTELDAVFHGDISPEQLMLKDIPMIDTIFSQNNANVFGLCVCLPLAQGFKFTTNVDGANSTKPLLAVRAGLLKRNFKYETKSKIQMEW